MTDLRPARTAVLANLDHAIDEAVGANALDLAAAIRDTVSLTNAERGVAFTLAYLGEATARELVAELDEGDETSVTDVMVLLAEHGLARHRSIYRGDVWRLTAPRRAT